MTSTAGAAALPGAAPGGTAREARRLLSAEILKFRTTRAARVFLAAFAAFSALALANNAVQKHFTLYPQAGKYDRAQALIQAAHARGPSSVAAMTADLMTSGQFVSVLFAMLIGIQIVTSEFAEQTVTSTFLTVPRRERVIGAKAFAAACLAALCWLISTVVNGVVTPVFLSTQHIDAPIGGWTVARAVLLSLVAFVVWAVFGLGLGAIIRNQLTSVVAGIAIYAGGFLAALAVFGGLNSAFHQNWLSGAVVISPAAAAKVMITPGTAFSHAPPQWAGALIMVAYTLVLAGAGAARMVRRDVG